MDQEHSSRDLAWRHQALSDVVKDFEAAHRRLRGDIDQETLERERLEDKLDEVKKDIQTIYLRKEVFDALFGPVQRGFYGVITLITMTVILALLYLVIKK